MEPMKNIPVYRHSAAYAVEHGELEAYKTSRWQALPAGMR